VFIIAVVFCSKLREDLNDSISFKHSFHILEIRVTHSAKSHILVSTRIRVFRYLMTLIFRAGLAFVPDPCVTFLAIPAKGVFLL
jgi:hypothetical protein